ncbi:EAL domain-containing protein [Serratia nevei]|uniref:EAL domain-containing protein n=1 Tax=Serratia nevei TaxID=2703794 RepID=UPI00286192C5|nr:EAL domain-containing protein [Serratia nevei]MDR8492143.1 EAL domain-containing protein [Serratia nevei]
MTWQLAIGGGGLVACVIIHCWFKSSISSYLGLLHAMLNDEIIPYYQPIIDAQKGTVHGIEVLARWISKGRVVMDPDVFIPLAEKHNLMIHLTRIMLERVESDIYPLKEHLPNGFHIGINFSLAQKECWSLEGDFLKLKKHFGRRINIVVEVTESAPLLDARVVGMLHRLRLQGILVALDDFGSGYSNLARLMSLPLDYLKMDKTFIYEIKAESDEGVITESIIRMMAKLGLQVISEGVETSYQSTYLLKHGVYLQQGYYWARALTAQQFFRFLLLKHNEDIEVLS